ncbi:MAG: DUF5668 domain-containing protein [Candidatus Gracilibacteria bacterium]
MKPCPCKDHVLWFGLVAFVIGATILLQRFDIVPVATWDYLWPSILLVTGLKMMLSSACPCRKEESCCGGADSCACEAKVMPEAKMHDSKKKSSKKK